MSKQSSDLATGKTDAEVAEALEAHLAAQGFKRTGSRNKNVWKKGFYWRIFASSRVEQGTAHLEVWNRMPYPGMGSCLMYFRNRGKLPELLEQLQAVVAGEAGAAAAVIHRSADELTYAGFWRRLAALLIDALLFYVVLGVLFAILIGAARGSARASGTADARFFVSNVLAAAALIIVWIYFALMESSKSQATLGKKALGIKVTDLQGRRISFGRATGRFWSKLISFFLVGIGFLLAAFTGRKQALHDLMARTVVVRKY